VREIVPRLAILSQKSVGKDTHTLALSKEYNTNCSPRWNSAL